MQSKPDFHTPWSYSLLGSIKNIIIEALLYFKMACKLGAKKRLVIFPSGTEKGNVASYLRAYEVGRELQNKFGWRVTIVPPRLSLKQRQRIVKWGKASVILMQMERHPLNRPRYYTSCPVVFDIDDADFLWDYARPLVKECCQESKFVIAGSSYIAEWVSQYNKNVKVVWTGGKSLVSSNKFPSHLERKNVVVWGHSRPQDYREEAIFIQDVIIKVAQKVPVEYWVFGVDNEATLKLVSNKVSVENITFKTFNSMSFDEFINQLKEGAVGLQFLSPNNPYSEGKSFGKILNYIMAGCVVIASDRAEHPKFFQHKDNGMLANSLDSWVDSIVYLLNNPAERDRIAKNGYESYESKLTVKAIAKKYDTIFNLL